jgi:hypothetical protein
MARSTPAQNPRGLAKDKVVCMGMVFMGCLEKSGV